MSNIGSRLAQRIPLRAVCLCLLLAAPACKERPEADQQAIQERLHEKGTAELMNEVSTAPEYRPPSDGRLTERQVRIYLDVRRREQKIREIAAKDVPASVTADLRAAVELGYNPKEYSWIEDRVREAQMLQTIQALNRQLARSRGELLARLKEQKRAAVDDAQRGEIEKQIEALEKSAVLDSQPTKDFNSALIARYKDDFEKL